MKNKVVVTITSLVAIFGFLFGVYVLTNNSSSQKSSALSETVSSQVNRISKDEHIKWSPNKKNILVEYSDLQCPACRNFHTLLKTIETSGSANFDITKKVTFVYRHFPLTAAHKNAQAAAYAAEAAGKQGKFFEYHDSLFENQEEWSELKDAKNFFADLAKEIKLDLEKFQKDINSKEIKERVEENLQSGLQAGVSSTPTFFLNGRQVSVDSAEGFIKLLKEVR